MIDPITISLIVGLATLIIERVFDYVRKIHSSSCASSCCGKVVDIELDNREK